MSDGQQDNHVTIREFLELKSQLVVISQQITTLNDNVSNRVEPLEKATQEHDKRLDDVEKKVWALFGIGATIGVAVVGLVVKFVEGLF